MKDTMMRQVMSWLMVGGVAAAMSPSAQAAEYCQPLLAGQTVSVGSVCVNNDAQNFTVTYTTEGGWTLGDLHLAVEKSLADIPKTKNGSPIPGQFEFTADAQGTTTYTFSIPLGDYGVKACSVPAASLIIAAHAAVKKDNGDGTYQSETAWGKGLRFVLKGNWANYFSYAVQCPPEPPPLGFCNGATAIAFGDNSFVDDYSLSRWGWENLIGPETTETVDLFRGRTEDVGDVTISYYNDLLTVEVKIDAGHAMSELRIRGEDISCQADNQACLAFHYFTVGSVLYRDAGGQTDFSPPVNYYKFEYPVGDSAEDGIYVVVSTVVGDTTCPIE